MRTPYRLYVAFVIAVFLGSCTAAARSEPVSAVAQAVVAAGQASYDGVVEPVRQTVMAAQVAGAVVDLPVRAGDSVKAGQVLLRIDARTAAQGDVAGQAQAQAARSALDLATKDVERQRHLYARQYISQSAMERAEAQYQATSEQLRSQIAQASIAKIQSDLFVIRAPYAGVIAELPVALGDMAMPGKPMLTLYDPTALRVTAALPQSALRACVEGQPFSIELPGLPRGQQVLSLTQMQILPTIDAGSHTRQIRIDLPKASPGIAPGLFARIWLPVAGDVGNHVMVPASAIVQRAELTGLYVIDANRHVQLRQVRLGQVHGQNVEILTGISAGERFVVDAGAALKALQ